MQFLCLIYQSEKAPPAMSDPRWAAIYQEYGALSAELAGKGMLRASYGLDAAAVGATVRVRQDEATRTAGLSAETPEVLSGIMVLDAKDAAEAEAVAARIPSARWGSVEVRPLKSYADDRKEVVASLAK